MITDEERREVARRLREMSETESVAAMLDLDDDVRTEMTLRVIRAIVGKGDIFKKLADFIDRPTCRKVIPNEMEGYVFCSKCGAEIGEYSVPNYCHNCGAEVLDD